MKLIVGLGNPGSQYENTRHNAGFMALNHLAKYFRLSFNKSQCDAKVALGQIKATEVVLAKPQTFMNLSGSSVKKLVSKYRLSPNDLLIVHDDLDLPVGKMRFKKGGGTGGHHGLESIKEALGNASFNRLKIGIDRPLHSAQVTSYVLGGFISSDQKLLDQLFPLINEAIGEFVQNGLTAAANHYNQDPQEKQAQAQAKETRRLLKESQTNKADNPIAPLTQHVDLSLLPITLPSVADSRVFQDKKLENRPKYQDWQKNDDI